MKKFIVLFFTITSFTTAHSQEQNTPTKQQTMEWIAGKMKDHLDGERYFVSYDNGYFKYKTTLRGNNTGLVRGHCFFTINLNKIAKIDGGSCWWFVATGVNVVYRTSACEMSDGIVMVEDKIDQNRIQLNSQDHGPFDFCVEEGLYERLVKAFDVLIKYNTQKKEGEVF